MTNTAHFGFLLPVLLLILHFLSSPLWLLSLSDIFFWFSWGYAKKPDNLGACSPRESSAESEWLDHYSDNPKICCCIMCQFEQKWTNERSVPVLWSWAGADGVPLWLRFYMALVCLCLHMCVEEERESAVEETGRVHSAVYKDWRQGTQCVLRQSLCISLPPSLRV